MTARSKRKRLYSAVGLLASYALFVAAVVLGLVEVRARVLRVMGTAEELQHWQTWREEASKPTEAQGGVQRRTPRSSEPPALVLMRDHFAVVVSAGVVFGSVFFGIGALLVRGLLAKSRAGEEVALRNRPPETTIGT